MHHFTDSKFDKDTNPDHNYPLNMSAGVVDFLYRCEGKFVSFVAVGNTLVVSTEENMYYFLCEPGGISDDDGQTTLTKYCEYPYIFLGNRVRSVEVQFGLELTVQQGNYDQSTLDFTTEDRNTTGYTEETIATVLDTYGLAAGSRERVRLSFRDNLTIYPQYTCILQQFHNVGMSIANFDTMELYGIREGESEPRLIASQ